MVPLAEMHGWTFRNAWFNFRRCMDGLSKRNLRIKMTRLTDRLVSSTPNRQYSEHPVSVQVPFIFHFTFFCSTRHIRSPCPKNTQPYIGVDFGVAAEITQNTQK
jgi:hypothetical protein